MQRFQCEFGFALYLQVEVARLGRGPGRRHDDQRLRAGRLREARKAQHQLVVDGAKRLRRARLPQRRAEAAVGVVADQATQIVCQVFKPENAVDEPRRLNGQWPAGHGNDPTVVATGREHTHQLGAHHAAGAGNQRDRTCFRLHECGA